MPFLKARGKSIKFKFRTSAAPDSSPEEDIMRRIAIASPRVWQFPAWVAQYAVRSFPRWFSRRFKPVVRPPKPIRLDFHLLDRRESPTYMSPVGPGAAWLASLIGSPQPLPGLAPRFPSL